MNGAYKPAGRLDLMAFVLLTFLAGTTAISCQMAGTQANGTPRADDPARATPIPAFKTATAASPTALVGEASSAASSTPATPSSRALTTAGAYPPKPGSPAAEIDAASKVIPILPKNPFAKGTRKPAPDRLIIPSISLDTKVIPLGSHYNEQGELIWDTAPFAAGHHIGTANPGEPGNVVISGHISSVREGAVFKRLPEVRVGDGVAVITDDRNYLYQVVDARTVEPTEIDVMNSTANEILTLITCFPDGVYTYRLVVTARRV